MEEEYEQVASEFFLVNEHHLRPRRQVSVERIEQEQKEDRDAGVEVRGMGMDWSARDRWDRQVVKVAVGTDRMLVVEEKSIGTG
jgi:hypothetical protein